MTVRVRPAVVEDADALGAVHVRAWQAAYRGHMPDSYLDALDPAQRAERWRRVGAGASESTHLVVEDDAGAVRGFVSFGPPVAGVEHPGEGVGQVYAINLEPSAWGQGLGRALLHAACEGLVAAGCSQAVLWVLDGNTRARRFYELAGWAWDGAVREDADWGDFVITELRYRRSLAGVAGR